MGWRKPGQEFSITVQEKKITCKSMTDEERAAFIEEVETVDSKDQSGMRKALCSKIVSIQDFDGEDVNEIMKYQAADILLDIYKQIISGNFLSKKEAKN